MRFLLLNHMLDRLAARVAIWAIVRLLGADCPTDIREEQEPGEPTMDCLGCDAARVVAELAQIAADD